MLQRNHHAAQDLILCKAFTSALQIKGGRLHQRLCQRVFLFPAKQESFFSLQSKKPKLCMPSQINVQQQIA